MIIKLDVCALSCDLFLKTATCSQLQKLITLSRYYSLLSKSIFFLIQFYTFWLTTQFLMHF